MLDFYLIADTQPVTESPWQLQYAGGIGDKEFEVAQQVGLVERHADYYGKFRWSSAQVANKVVLLASCPYRATTALHDILRQAEAAGMGLVAFGD